MDNTSVDLATHSNGTYAVKAITAANKTLELDDDDDCVYDMILDVRGNGLGSLTVVSRMKHQPATITPKIFTLVVLYVVVVVVVRLGANHIMVPSIHTNLRVWPWFVRS
jgi:hypothetical protein